MIFYWAIIIVKVLFQALYNFGVIQTKFTYLLTNLESGIKMQMFCETSQVHFSLKLTCQAQTHYSEVFVSV